MMRSIGYIFISLFYFSVQGQIKPIDKNSPLPYFDISQKYFRVNPATADSPMTLTGRAPLPYLKSDLFDISRILNTIDNDSVKGKIQAQRKDFIDKIPDFGDPIKPRLALRYIQSFTNGIETYLPYVSTPEIVGEIIYSALFCLDLQQRTGLEKANEFDKYIGLLQLSKEALLIAQGKNRRSIHDFRTHIRHNGNYVQFMLESKPWTGTYANDLNGFYQYAVRKGYLMTIEQPGTFYKEHQYMPSGSGAETQGAIVAKQRNEKFKKLLDEQYLIASVLDLTDKTIYALQTWVK